MSYQCPGFLTERLLLIKLPLPHIVIDNYNLTLEGNTKCMLFKNREQNIAYTIHTIAESLIT